MMGERGRIERGMLRGLLEQYVVPKVATRGGRASGQFAGSRLLR